MNNIHHLVDSTPVEVPRKTYETLGDLLDKPIENIDFLIEGLLPKGTFAGIVGRSGVNKSTFCRQLCLCVVLKNAEFIGHKVNTVHHRALYIYSEDARNTVARSYQKFVKAVGELPEDMKDGIEVVHLDEFETHDDLLAFLDSQTSDKQYDLICFDCYSDLLTKFGLDVNSNTDQRTLFPHLYRFQKNGAVILFNHHTSDKASGIGSFLGASTFRQKSRVLIEIVEGEGSTRYVCVTKSNYTDKLDPLECWLDDNLLFQTDGTRVPIAEVQKHLHPDNLHSARQVIDWDTIFGTSDMLETKVLCKRLFNEYAMPERTAKRRIKRELERVKQGIYRRRGSQSNTTKQSKGSSEQPELLTDVVNENTKNPQTQNAR